MVQMVFKSLYTNVARACTKGVAELRALSWSKLRDLVQFG